MDASSPVSYFGEVLNNIGTLGLTLAVPPELGELCEAIKSNLRVTVDDGIKRAPQRVILSSKWVAVLNIAPVELSLSLFPPDGSSAAGSTLRIPLPRTVDTRSAKVSCPGDELDIKLALSAGPDSSNGWRREIHVPRPLTARQLEATRDVECAHCRRSILRPKHGGKQAREDEHYFYRVMDLPSEHWAELVECWMCHQEDYGRNGRFERTTQGQPGCLSVGASYVLLSGDDVSSGAVAVTDPQDEDEQRVPAAKRNPFEPSIVTCISCRSKIGEAFYDSPSQHDFPTTFRIPLYYVSFAGNPDDAGRNPRFLDYFVCDLLEDARTHGSYRLVVEEKGRSGPFPGGNENLRLLIWLLAWDLEVLTNMDGPDDAGKRSGTGGDRHRTFRALKLLYQPLPDVEGNPMAKAWLGAAEKLDRLRYDAGPINGLVAELGRANTLLPPGKRKMHGFNVAILRYE
ncbi:ubiquitin-conjugating enzyme E2-binding protein [Hyaloraphidium curvatum]|nr:ubiquitin-conjugating enzyme E2-binding protein [Hyaloraphidium curvatum]